MIAVCAVALAGAPGLARGDWSAAACPGSTDASTRRRRPARTSAAPRRSPCPTIPAGSPTSGRRTRAPRSHCRSAPSSSPGSRQRSGRRLSAIAVVVFALLPLAAFACARACFESRGRFAFRRGVFLSRTPRSSLSATSPGSSSSRGRRSCSGPSRRFRLSLEPGLRAWSPCSRGCSRGGGRELGLGFAPYFAAVIVVVAASYTLEYPQALRRIVRRSRSSLPCSPFLRVLHWWRSPPGSGITWRQAASRPRTRRRSRTARSPRRSASCRGSGRSRRAGRRPPRSSGSSAASLLAAALLGRGDRGSEAADPARGLPGGRARLTLGGYVFFLAAGVTPYLTYKVLAYGAPFLVLLALSPLRVRRRQARRRRRRRRCRARRAVRDRGDKRRPRRPSDDGAARGAVGARLPSARSCPSRSRTRGTRRGRPATSATTACPWTAVLHPHGRRQST